MGRGEGEGEERGERGGGRGEGEGEERGDGEGEGRGEGEGEERGEGDVSDLNLVNQRLSKLTKLLWLPVVWINSTNISDHTHILSARYCCCSLIHQTIPILVLYHYIIITSSL